LYGALRQSERPLKVTFTCLKNEFRSLLDKVGFESWKVFSTEKSFLEEFDKEKLIYLSPESPHVLQVIDPEKACAFLEENFSTNFLQIYIVGGIVDHNRLKGLSYKTASELGIPSVRLPILENFGTSLPNSLNPNHVFEILQDMAQNNDWVKSLKNHIPVRYQKPKNISTPFVVVGETTRDTTEVSVLENNARDTNETLILEQCSGDTNETTLVQCAHDTNITPISEINDTQSVVQNNII